MGNTSFGPARAKVGDSTALAQGHSGGWEEPTSVPVIGCPGAPRPLIIGRGELEARVCGAHRVLGSQGLGRVLTERGRGRPPTNG